jgi:protein-arginine kinase activator protein McsA
MAEKDKKPGRKCQACGAPATVFVTDISDGKMTTGHFCGKCAEESRKPKKSNGDA